MRLDPTNWEKGINQAYLQELCAYWKNRFDWKQPETYLNRFHHYTSDIDGLPTYFIHEKGAGTKTVPFLLTHGWPLYVLVSVLTYRNNRTT